MNRSAAIVLSGLLWGQALSAVAEEAAEGSGDPVFISLTRRADTLGKLPSNISRVTAEEIEQMGAKTLDEVLDALPSIDISRSGTLGNFATVRMRGVPSSSQVQVLVDDRPVGGNAIQFTDLAQIPVENIERIEVVRGGSSVLYGANTVGGIIHVITKRHEGSTPLSSVGFEMRSFDTQVSRADFGAGSGPWDFYINGNKTKSEGFQQNQMLDDVALSANAGYTFASGAKLSADISRTDHEVGDSQGTSVPLDEWDGKKEKEAADKNAYAEQNITAGRLKLSLPLGSFGAMETSFHGSDQDYSQFATRGASAIFRQENQIMGNETRFLLPSAITLGLSYERDEQNKAGALPIHMANGAVYLQKKWRLGTLTLIPAGRLDQHSTFGNVFNPRLTAVWQVSEAWKVSSNAARSFRAPSFLELFYSDPFSPTFTGNADLNPETSWTYDLGLSHSPVDGQRNNVTAFYTRLKDRIAPTFTTYVNAPRAEMSGVEFETEKRKGAWTARGNYTYQRAMGGGITASQFKALRLTPRHMANASLTWGGPKGWAVTNTLQYVDKQFQLDNHAGIQFPSYTLWHARVSKKLLAAELYAAVDNITDRHYTESLGNDPITFATTLYPQPGRTFWGGVSIRFRD